MKPGDGGRCGSRPRYLSDVKDSGLEKRHKLSGLKAPNSDTVCFRCLEGSVSMKDE